MAVSPEKNGCHEVENKHDQFKEPRKFPVWASFSTCNASVNM